MSTGGGIRFGIPIAEKQSLSFGVAIDQTEVEIDRLDPDTPLQYINFSNEFCNRQNSCSNLSLPMTVAWASDTKDSVLLPTRGTFQRAGFEISPGGDLKYYKANYQLQQFFPVTRSMVLMLNGELGYGKGLSNQELPFYKNFYAGGVGSVRGYDTASLGPYETNLNGDIVRLGGTSRVVFNAELSMPMPGFGVDKSLRFGPFFDAGQVYADSTNGSAVVDSGAIRMSAGLAATWISPFGPLKFSLAKALNSEDNDKLQVFQFQMGQTF
jgi:outer membrane protein insertion porin family